MQAGLTDAGYSPHKGLSAEETRFHRLGDGTLPVSMNKCEGERFVPALKSLKHTYSICLRLCHMSDIDTASFRFILKFMLK